MENEFTKVMSERTDEDLIKIVTVDRINFNPKAVEAAQSEIENRKIDTNKIEEIKEKAIIEKEKKEKLDSMVVGSGIRFLNFLIDFFVWIVLLIIFSLILGLFIQTTDDGNFTIIGYLLVLGSYIVYYSTMEIKFQKTVGKFITKTKVVNKNGQIPENSEIITRSICRLIPFDRISFLFVQNGIHDYLSNTKVIKDTID